MAAGKLCGVVCVGCVACVRGVSCAVCSVLVCAVCCVLCCVSFHFRVRARACVWRRTHRKATNALNTARRNTTSTRGVAWHTHTHKTQHIECCVLCVCVCSTPRHVCWLCFCVLCLMRLLLFDESVALPQSLYLSRSAPLAQR